MKISGLLAFVLALAGCGKTPPGPKIDPALSSLIPPDTILLAGARLDKLQETSIYKKHLADRPVPLIDDFPKRIGLQVKRQDLWELLLISDGKQSLVLGRGKFANEAEPRVERLGGTRFGYKGYNLVGDEREAVLLVSPSVIGFGATVLISRVMDSMLFQTSTHDPLTYSLTILLLAAVALAACLLPARRATRVNPIDALRTE